MSLNVQGTHDDHDNCNANSVGSWKHVSLSGNDCRSHENQDNSDTNSLGSWKDGANGWSESVASGDPAPSVRMSWADMAQEDELEGEGEEGDSSKQSWADECNTAEASDAIAQKKSPSLSRDEREYIRFKNVGRKTDFICLERINGKIVNILDGLELHTGVFSAAEQKRIVDYIYSLQEMGRKRQLKGKFLLK